MSGLEALEKEIENYEDRGILHKSFAEPLLDLLKPIEKELNVTKMYLSDDFRRLCHKYNFKRVRDIEYALKRLDVYDKCNYQTTIHKDVLQISKELKALEILKDYLYIDDKNTLRLRNTTNVNLVGIIFPDREVIDLLKEVLL